jgi:predicted nucleic acid-binding protein
VIVADSSTWIAYFNGQAVPAVARLDKALSTEEDIVVLSILVAEVLAGFRNERDFEAAYKVLMDFPALPLSKETYANAARLYRKLRHKGVTVRGVVDCVIAQACIENGAGLLTLDRDFRQIARHSQLKLVQP